MTSPSTQTNTQERPTTVNGDLRCALTDKVIHADEAYWAPPLVTAKELIVTILRTLFQNPGALGQILMAEQPNVPYAADARPELGRRRSIEQVKLLGMLLLLAALLVVPIVILVG
ncbi:MAG: hypothetical protein EI684_18480 [Candidatus Viridilinea halotolerans]|uniref:Uncharacterized protein n=1 Tax=Candidatus Viridilinea halotolerans TaxID=2491704 RepID=A0A426TTH7_9CHLR|nr:MAG: hypothetical protein EI684_18480 [Candidatus Viridilinea halotolerans]